ncbi:MAG: hypothetical protein KGI33_00610 [Thaumarchaeota archaeon]|nr:hypothetical protein [Nitrososphaerota archaeon]
MILGGPRLTPLLTAASVGTSVLPFQFGTHFFFLPTVFAPFVMFLTRPARMRRACHACGSKQTEIIVRYAG